MLVTLFSETSDLSACQAVTCFGVLVCTVAMSLRRVMCVHLKPAAKTLFYLYGLFLRSKSFLCRSGMFILLRFLNCLHRLYGLHFVPSIVSFVRLSCSAALCAVICRFIYTTFNVFLFAVMYLYYFIF